tara:strand:+ start:1252 stop:2124 length:873 start_codon:yes stop_codon:yes gene_type:complete
MLLCDVELLFEMTMKHLPQGAFSLLTTLSVLTGLWGWPATVTAGAVNLDRLSHRAVYELSLASAATGSGVARVEGRMALEWIQTCEGFTALQRIGMRVADMEGRQVDSDYTLSSWESKDGAVFRFNIRSLAGGRKEESFSGRATLEGHGKAGNVRFTKPDGLKLELGAGTVFPTEHTSLLVRSASAGERRIAARMFDGSGKKGLFDVIAFVTDAMPDGASEVMHPVLDKVPAWRMRMAFFGVGRGDETPDYEVDFRMFANGVADHLVLDYGDFAVAGRLSRLEPLTEPGC